MGQRLACAVAAAIGLFASVTVGTGSPAGAVTAVPRITSISPSSGSTTGGNWVVVHGTGFLKVGGVMFGDAEGWPFRIVSATKLRVEAPARPAGTVHIRLWSTAGTSPRVASDRYTYVAPPEVTGLSASVGGVAGGERITVLGKHFTSTASVRFGLVPAMDVAVLSKSMITATAPPAAAATVHVRVTTRYGTSGVSDANLYTYLAAPPPAVSSVTAPGPYGPDTLARPQIRDTACTDTTCYGVGFYVTNYANVAIVETLKDGVWTWSALPRPSDGVPGASELYSIWCGSDSCVAVGAYLTTNDRTKPLIERLISGTWTASGGSSPYGAFDAYYDSVACASLSACVASGFAPGGSIVAHSTGGTWSTEFLPMPDGLSGGVSRVSIACGSATHCAFAGNYADGAVLHAFTETFDGTDWSPTLLPDPPGGATWSMLDGISCPSANQCVAVGGYKSADNTTWLPFIGTDSDGSWTTKVAPLPSDSVADMSSGLTRLDAISCTAGHCTAAGSYDTAQGPQEFLVTLDNGAWSAATVATSGAATTNGGFYSTACTTATTCVAVGQSSSSGGHLNGVVTLHSTFGTTQVQAPLPTGISDTDLSLRQVACSASGVCSAIGILSTDPSQWLLVTITT